VALIKSTTLSFFLLIGTVLLSTSFASEDELLLEELRESLAKVISAQMADGFRSDLKDTGLSSSDVERIVANLEDAVAACFLDSVVEYAQTHETPLADLVHEVGNEMAISGVGVEFEELLIPCLNAARAEAGIALWIE
jgi:hypothetical protein